MKYRDFLPRLVDWQNRNSLTDENPNQLALSVRPLVARWFDLLSSPVEFAKNMFFSVAARLSFDEQTGCKISVYLSTNLPGRLSWRFVLELMALAELDV